MTETKHKTTVEIAVDDRSLKTLGQTLDKAFAINATDAFEKSIDRSTRAVGKLVDAVEKLGKIQSSNAKRNEDQGDRAERKARDREKRSAFAVAAGHGLAGAIAGAAGMAPIQRGFLGNGISTIASGAGSLAQMGINAIPVPGMGILGAGVSALASAAGGLIGGSISAGEGYYGQFAAMQQARSRAYGATGIANGDYRQSVIRGTAHYGVGPTELPGLLSQMAQGSQLRGDDLQDVVPMLTRMQMRGGVEAGGAGSFMAAAGGAASGQFRNPQAEQAHLERTLSAAVEAGVSQSRLTELLTTIAGATTDMQEHGIQIGTDAMTSLFRGLSGLGPDSGFGGMAGMRAAQSMMQSVQGAGRQESPMNMLMLRAAGFGGNTESGTYMGALQQLQESPQEVMANFLEQQRQWGGSADANAYGLMQGMESIGTHLSVRQARHLSGMSADDLARFRGEGGAQAWQDLLAGQQGEFGTAAVEANQQYTEAGTGGRVSGDIQALRAIETQLVNEYLPQAVHLARQLVDAGLHPAATAAAAVGGASDALVEAIDSLRALLTSVFTRMGLTGDQATTAASVTTQAGLDTARTAVSAVGGPLGTVIVSAEQFLELLGYMRRIAGNTAATADVETGH